VKVVEECLKNIHSRQRRRIIRTALNTTQFLLGNEMRLFTDMVHDAMNGLWDNDGQKHPYMLSILGFSVTNNIAALANDQKISVLLLTLGQYLVHRYILPRLRSSNKSYLTGDSENMWCFVQFAVLVLIDSIIREYIHSVVSKLLESPILERNLK
jgi:hypothetical protein